MRLRRSRPKGPQIPAIPLGNLALLVGTCVIVAGMFSASRGPGLRFASVDRDGALRVDGAVHVEVFSEQEARIDGALVPFDRLAAEVSSRLGGRSDPSVILAVAPEVSYETMLLAYEALAELPGAPRIALPLLSRGTRG